MKSHNDDEPPLNGFAAPAPLGRAKRIGLVVVALALTALSSSASAQDVAKFIGDLTYCGGTFLHASRTVTKGQKDMANGWRSLATYAINRAAQVEYEMDVRRYNNQREARTLLSLTGDRVLMQSANQLPLTPPRPFSDIQQIITSRVESIAAQWDAVWFSGDKTSVNQPLQECNSKVSGWG